MKAINIMSGAGNSKLKEFIEHKVAALTKKDSEFDSIPVGSLITIAKESEIPTVKCIGRLTSETRTLAEGDRLAGLEDFPHVRDVEWIYQHEIKLDIKTKYTWENLYRMQYTDQDAEIIEGQLAELKIGSTRTSPLFSLIEYTNNIILFGPPGTGKTYAVEHFRSECAQLDSPSDIKKFERNSELNLTAIIALTIYQNTRLSSYNIDSLLKLQPLANYMLDNDIKPSVSALENYLDKLTSDEGIPDQIDSLTDGKIIHKKDGNRWSLTEDGIKHVKDNILGKPEADWSANFRTRSKFVTFHPSFAYEEFVEGLRPEVVNGQLSYTVRDGVLKRICRDAEQELVLAEGLQREPRKFILVIDEINRANIAKVFGELMTLIEDDKRVTFGLNGLEGPRVTLPYSGESFGIPKNLIFIGTMNTADRSIALLDLALRRRFTFLEVHPDPEVVRATTGENGIIEGVDVPQILENINFRLRRMLDRDHQIGHSYFTNIRSVGELRFRWYRKIIPLLQEYFYNDGEKIQQIAGEAFIELEPDTEDVGKRRAYGVIDLDDKQFITALKKLLLS